MHYARLDLINKYIITHFKLYLNCSKLILTSSRMVTLNVTSMFSILPPVLFIYILLYFTYIYTAISNMNSSKTMKTITVDTPINLKVVRFELDFSSLLKKPEQEKKVRKIKVPRITINKKKTCLIPLPPLAENDQVK